MSVEAESHLMVLLILALVAVGLIILAAARNSVGSRRWDHMMEPAWPADPPSPKNRYWRSRAKREAAERAVWRQDAIEQVAKLKSVTSELDLDFPRTQYRVRFSGRLGETPYDHSEAFRSPGKPAAVVIFFDEAYEVADVKAYSTTIEAKAAYLEAINTGYARISGDIEEAV